MLSVQLVEAFPTVSVVEVEYGLSTPFTIIAN